MADLAFKSWLVLNGVTQRELAEFLGISKQSVNKKVNGKEDWSLDQARKICGRYHVSANVFIPEALN